MKGGKGCENIARGQSWRNRHHPIRLRARALFGGGSWTWGWFKGIPLTVRKVAPLGDPIEITIRNYELSLRKADAQSVIVND